MTVVSIVAVCRVGADLSRRWLSSGAVPEKGLPFYRAPL